MEIARCSENIVIVGAGKIGQESVEYFAQKGIPVTCFFDNSPKLAGKMLKEIPVKTPRRIPGNTIYAIAIDSAEQRLEVYQQLIALGISPMNIADKYWMDYEYFSTVDRSCYKDILSEQYRKRFGRELDWENPMTYNEIINWEKLYDNDERKSLLADKIKVHDWLREKISEEHITKRYGVWDDAYDIDFDALPNAFALKLNHGSGMNIIVKDKMNMNRDRVCKQLNAWKSINYAFVNGTYELHYEKIKPQIFCEEFLDGVAESVYDYDIYCFHGEPRYIHCIKGCHTSNWQGAFYDTAWVRQPFIHGCSEDTVLAPRPKHLDKMLELSRVLSKSFRHVRVDWYDLPDGRVLFCEMTFTSWAGLSPFVPDRYDMVFGGLVRGV